MVSAAARESTGQTRPAPPADRTRGIGIGLGSAPPRPVPPGTGRGVRSFPPGKPRSMASPAVRPSRSATTLLVLGTLLAPTPARAAAQQPFTPGLRWTLPAPLDQPWIPTSVAFAAADQLVWAAGPGAASRVVLAPGAGSGPAAPLYWEPTAAGALGSLEVAAAALEPGLFALSQVPAPDAWHRRTLVTRHDPLAAAAGAPFQAAWSLDLGPIGNGPGRLAVDARGERVLAAAFDDGVQAATVSWIGGDGTLLERTTLGAAALRGLALSADGAVGALIGGGELHLLPGPGAAPLSFTLAFEPAALALSADGGLVAAGGAGRAQVFLRRGSAYQALVPIVAPPELSAARVALSADGSTLAIAWWNLAGSGLLRLEVRDARRGHVFMTRDFQSPAGALQNAPQVLRMTADGARVALASWGDGAGSPQVVLLERDGGASLLEVDLPGSALALDLDASGTRVVVATKNVHANQFGSTGELRLYDTGERDLEALELPRAGGALRLAARRDGATRAFFLLGRPAAPQTIPGVGGRLVVERAGAAIHSRPTDAAGRAWLELALPADPLLVGSRVRAQAALRAGGGLHLGVHALDLLIL